MCVLNPDASLPRRTVTRMAARGVHHANITWLPHTKVAWGGKLGTSGEVWTNSLRFLHLDNSVVTQAQATAMAPGVWTALSGWLGSGQNASHISPTAVLQWLKINPINGSGLQYPGDTNIYAPGDVTGNAAITAAVPFYQTFALTLRTGVKRGRAHAGRIFPPVVAPTMDGATGRCSLASAADMAGAFQTCMQGMQTAIRTASSVGGFAVFSPGDALKSTVPLAYLITSVVSDTVPDVQHRRTNHLARQEGTPALVAG